MDKETETGLKNLIGLEGLARLNALTILSSNYKDKPDHLAARLIYKGIETMEAEIDNFLKAKEL